MKDHTASCQSAPGNDSPPASVSGKYSLVEMLREVEIDADDLSGGKMLDQERIHALFRNGSRDEND